MKEEDGGLGEGEEGLEAMDDLGDLLFALGLLSEVGEPQVQRLAARAFVEVDPRSAALVGRSVAADDVVEGGRVVGEGRRPVKVELGEELHDLGRRPSHRLVVPVRPIVYAVGVVLLATKRELDKRLVDEECSTRQRVPPLSAFVEDVDRLVDVAEVGREGGGGGVTELSEAFGVLEEEELGRLGSPAGRQLIESPIDLGVLKELEGEEDRLPFCVDVAQFDEGGVELAVFEGVVAVRVGLTTARGVDE